jgi:hypothetical protein
VLTLTPIAGIPGDFLHARFLAVRAFGTLVLLLAEPLIESAFQRQEMIKTPPRLRSSTCGSSSRCSGWACPIRSATQIAWVTSSAARWRGAALTGLIYGALLCFGALSVH